MPVRETDLWEAVYYTNPVPLSSRSLLAFALLYDRVHIPGLSIDSGAALGAGEAARLRATHSTAPDIAAYINLRLWAAEQRKFADFIHLPDQDKSDWTMQDLLADGGRLLDETYSADVSSRIMGWEAAQGFMLGNSLTWPLYQVRAMQYAAKHRLPLVSDDPTCIPPFPQHPDTLGNAKGLAQQIAVEALSLVLPNFRSVDPDHIAEFRAEVQPLVKPFRLEMVKMTSELASAIAAGADDEDLKRACKLIAESRVNPALSELSIALNKPSRPIYKVAIDIGEAALSAGAAAGGASLTVAWALLRGSKLATDYADLNTTRDGQKRSGLSFLLRVNEHFTPGDGVSDWDRRDWRCSGFVDIIEPDPRMDPELAAFVKGRTPDQYTLQRRLFQRTTQRRVIT